MTMGIALNRRDGAPCTLDRWRNRAPPVGAHREAPSTSAGVPLRNQKLRVFKAVSSGQIPPCDGRPWCTERRRCYLCGLKTSNFPGGPLKPYAFCNFGIRNPSPEPLPAFLESCTAMIGPCSGEDRSRG